jgi:hypothetical protein
MNPSVDLQGESCARYGRAIGHAAANVVHEVNAPLGVALARVQLAIRLLDELSPEQAAALDEQLRGCEAAIRSSANVVRDLNYLRHDVASSNDAVSAVHVLNAAHQLALLDAAHAGCELVVQLPEQDVLVTGHPQHLLVLLLELIWDCVRHGALHISLVFETRVAREKFSPGIRIVSDVSGFSDYSTQSWLQSLAALCQARVVWQQNGRGTAWIVELDRNNEVNSSLQGAI